MDGLHVRTFSGYLSSSRLAFNCLYFAGMLYRLQLRICALKSEIALNCYDVYVDVLITSQSSLRNSSFFNSCSTIGVSSSGAYGFFGRGLGVDSLKLCMGRKLMEKSLRLVIDISREDWAAREQYRRHYISCH